MAGHNRHLGGPGPCQARPWLRHWLVDSHSKWIEVHITNASTTAVTIEKLQLTFSGLGLPEVLVTDNGSSFSSSEFTNYVKANGIQYVKTVPYHPASNGLAERACLKKLSHGSLQDQVNSFLFKYRTAPQSTIDVSPAELLMNCKQYTHLDLLVTDIGERVRKRQNLQKHSHDLHAKDKLFRENDQVLAKNFGHGPPWITGKILKESGATTFLVELSDGRVIRRHSDQQKPNSLDFQVQLQPDVNEQLLPDTDSEQPNQEPVSCRHSTRNRRPPARFSPDNY